MTKADASQKPEAPGTPETPREPGTHEQPAEPTAAGAPAAEPESATTAEPATAGPEPEAAAGAPAGAPSAAGAEEPAAGGEASDEIADLIRVGKVGSGRRLSPPDAESLRVIRDFAAQRHLPGLGTLLELARAYSTSGRGPGLSVSVFTELRSQLDRLVSHLEAVAIHAGPVLFLKTRAKNQPGTALRWLNEEERQALREHPELLDHPARLTASLKKLLAGEPEEADD